MQKLSGREEDILKAIRIIRPELNNLLSVEEAKNLEEFLLERLDFLGIENLLPESITEILKEISKYEPARERLSQLISRDYLKSYFPLPVQENIKIPRPGEIVVCPVNPKHLKTRLREKGQHCRLHGVELVLEHSINHEK